MRIRDGPGRAEKQIHINISEPKSRMHQKVYPAFVIATYHKKRGGDGDG